MTRRGIVAGTIALAAALAGTHGQTPPAQQPPAFRATTDLVTVDVSVRAGDATVPGLTAGDFLLLDNGVRQRIESVESARVPLDVSLLVDVSGGRPEWWGTPRPAPEIATRLNEIVRKVSAVLRPDDRWRLVTIDTYADEVMPLQPAGRSGAVGPRLSTNGLSSLHDALVATLLQPVEPNRRHLIVATTKGEDSVSAADVTAVRDVAQRSDAVLHVVLGHSLVGDTTCAFDCQFPRRRFWRPFRRASQPLLPEWAESTGGAFHDVSLLGFMRDYADEFKGVFDEFRQGDVLRYRPQGVKCEGWHEIAVTVPGQPRYVVRARRGYAIEAAPPATPPKRAAPGAIPSGLAPDTVNWLAEMYELGDYRAFTAGLDQLTDLAKVIRDFRAAGNPWPAAPRRDAAFGLEIAVAGTDRSRRAAATASGDWWDRGPHLPEPVAAVFPPGLHRARTRDRRRRRDRLTRGEPDIHVPSDSRGLPIELRAPLQPDRRGPPGRAYVGRARETERRRRAGAERVRLALTGGDWG